MMPRGVTCMDPRDTVGRIYKEDHYTLLHTKYESSVPCGFKEEDFFYVFPIVSLWNLILNDPRGGPRGMVGRICKEDHYTLLHTNMKALGLVVSETISFLCFSHDAPRGGAHMDPRGTVGRIYKEDHYTLLHTKYESSRLCGFGKEDFFCFSNCKSMGPNDPQGRTFFDPRGMVGWIYKEDHYT